MKQFMNMETKHEDRRNDEFYVMPEEACCSPEFPEGCIGWE